MLRAVDAGRNCWADPGIAEVITRDATFAALLTFALMLWRMKLEMMALHLSFTLGAGIIKCVSCRLQMFVSCTATAYHPLLFTTVAALEKDTRDTKPLTTLTFALA